MMDKETHQGHYVKIKKEFARQVDTLSRSPVFTDQHVIDRIIEAAQISGDERVLDLGCGPGILTEAVAPFSQEVIAFDLTPEMVDQTRQRCEKRGFKNVTLMLGEAENLPFDNSTFDIIVTRLTIHHFLDPSTAISNMVRVLKPKGKIVVADIVSSENSNESDLHNALEILRDPSHSKMLSIPELKKEISSASLMITMEDSWITQREFNEWIKITNDPSRKGPLYTIMYNLAKANASAGINLKLDQDRILFDHKWLLLVAEKKIGVNI
jgi:ubiquinone/menaquinone biosynthesis C-methylase UbiE